MRAEELFEAIGDVGDDLLEKSEKIKDGADSVPQQAGSADGKGAGKKTKILWMRILPKAAAVAAAAAALFLVISVGRMFFSRAGSAAPAEAESQAAMAQGEMKDADEAMAEEAAAEEAGAAGAMEAPAEAAAESEEVHGADNGSGGSMGFAKACAEEILAGGKENSVISPLNLYLACAMLAEATDGTTRQEILSALGVSDIAELREYARSLVNKATYSNERSKSLACASIWMNEGRSYEEDALLALGEYYGAEGFTGEMGSDALNQALQTWIDEKTEGLLSDSLKGISLDANTVMALVATLYYKAAWEQVFPQAFTAEEEFHGQDGNITVPMMHGLIADVPFYETDAYTAAYLPLMDGKRMWFFLPKEGGSADALLSDADVYETIAGRNEEEAVWAFLQAAVPKFDIQMETDLLKTLPELGIREAVYGGDFSALVRGGEGLSLSTALHSVRIAADEDGVTGAAYTLMAAEEGAALAEERTLTLDRPFVFALSDMEGDLWFLGKIEKP
ncbi:MAG: hypothetical protein IJL72_09425 [Lachnospiraceae bacterium]|nr:hypothetical protein [Lachnospiraceae bacterium]